MLKVFESLFRLLLRPETHKAKLARLTRVFVLDDAHIGDFASLGEMVFESLFCKILGEVFNKEASAPERPRTLVSRSRSCVLSDHYLHLPAIKYSRVGLIYFLFYFVIPIVML